MAKAISDVIFSRARRPSCEPTNTVKVFRKKMQSHDPNQGKHQALHCLHPFFIHHQTPARRAFVLLCPGYWLQFPASERACLAKSEIVFTGKAVMTTDNANLNLIKIRPRFERNDVICGYSNNRFVCGILGSVEGQSSLTWHQLQRKHISFITDINSTPEWWPVLQVYLREQVLER